MCFDETLPRVVSGTMESIDWLPIQESFSHTNSTLKTVDDFNNEELMRRLASLIYLSILLVVGLIGNAMVLILYPLKFPTTTNRTFIVGLALMDVLVCVITIPFEIAQMVFQYTFYDVVACKIFRSFGLCFSLSSMFVLVGMSYEKYRRICKPFQKQMSVKISRLFIAVTFLVSCIISSPNIFQGGIRLVALGNNVTGHDCSLSDKFANTVLPIVSEASIFIITLLCVVSIIILYTLIGKTIIAQNKFRKQFAQIETRTTKISTVNVKDRKTVYGEVSPVANRRISVHNNYNDQQSSIRKVTKIAFVVSVVFLVSNIPHLVISLMTAIKGKFLLPPGPVVSAVMPILARSFIINNVANPIIYGVMDERFRQNAKTLIVLLCKIRK